LTGLPIDVEINVQFNLPENDTTEMLFLSTAVCWPLRSFTVILSWPLEFSEPYWLRTLLHWHPESYIYRQTNVQANQVTAQYFSFHCVEHRDRHCSIPHPRETINHHEFLSTLKKRRRRKKKKELNAFWTVFKMMIISAGVTESTYVIIIANFSFNFRKTNSTSTLHTRHNKIRQLW